MSDTPSKKKCLVIGANSFIGANLIKSVSPTYDVTGVYHHNKELLQNNIPNIEIDALMAQPIPNVDAVFIISAFIPNAALDSQSREAMYRANVELVHNICRIYPESKIIYCSSVSVYQPNSGYITETDSLGGLNEYGISKLWGEKIVEQHKRYSILRLTSVYGVGMKQTSIFPAYVRQALERKTITVWGDGQRCQNYIHVSDVVEYLKRSASVEENDIYLAAAPSSITNLALASMIAETTNSQLIYEGVDASPSFFYNNQYTTNKLQYTPQIRLEDGINELIKWRKNEF